MKLSPGWGWQLIRLKFLKNIYLYISLGIPLTFMNVTKPPTPFPITICITENVHDTSSAILFIFFSKQSINKWGTQSTLSNVLYFLTFRKGGRECGAKGKGVELIRHPFLIVTVLPALVYRRVGCLRDTLDRLHHAWDAVWVWRGRRDLLLLFVLSLGPRLDSHDILFLAQETRRR